MCHERKEIAVSAGVIERRAVGGVRMYHAGMDGRNRADEPDPFADYIEWAEHRYDPGYYLGGKLPPHLRSASLGPRARRRAGVLIGLLGMTMLNGGLMTLGRASTAASFAIVPLAALILFAAVKMYRSGSPAQPRHRP